MTEARETDGHPRGRHGLARCGALGSDITRAVEVLSAQNGIPGSMAYRLLVQAAADARVSVYDAAAAIAQSSIQQEDSAC